MYLKKIKPILDFIISFIGFVIVSPLLFIVTILLFLANQGKPFFFQKRPGLHGKPFYIIKFKTMNDKRDDEGNLMSDAERLTRIGSFVRKTSIDELPQLINVLKGDISLVGPRPLLMEYLPLYNTEQARRHEVKPGITGWAQVNGRNSISWEEKFRLDVEYVDNCSLLLDCKILWMTVKKVLVRDGISAEGVVTMDKFTGSTK
ncbi:sugar transferase [Halosquirtibacter xylanolyticus]|uniref:sugar transferase n=1 Tax=Halosquirtibacter xylanolyticus TaxID=3374599 RepID=UPI0037486643|nr:sugar transferase [Prolixibacteraceae bacterium]